MRRYSPVVLILFCILLDFGAAILLNNAFLKHSDILNTKHERIVKKTLSRSPTPSPTILTPTPTPIFKAIPTTTVTPTLTPIPPFVLSSTDQDLLNLVNEFRKQNSLFPVSIDKTVCDFATTRAQEITIGFNHDGFTNRLNDHSLPYSSYSLVVENIAMNTKSSEVVSSWIQSPPHNQNLKEATSFACIGHSGDYYVYEGWKP